MRVVCFDLDDTLYKEMDYLRSAYREVASYAAEHCYGCSDTPMMLAAKAYDAMLAAYLKGENAFECLNRFLGIELPVSEYLQIYRNHKPQISLSGDVGLTLNTLKEKGDIIGLITDGRSVQQRNKIDALGLSQWIANEDVVISEECGSNKPNIANYNYFMRRYPECGNFIYVGDNLQKDFIAPNTLGWTTICLLDDGSNIHKQDFASVPRGYMPIRIIRDLKELNI